MALGVAREGSEPSLFYQLTASQDGTLSAVGWFLHPELPEFFELEVWESSSTGPQQVGTYICGIKEGQAEHIVWKHPIILEVKRAL